MKQAKNEIFIEGILVESDIKTGASKGENKPYIRGEIKILVNQVIDGQTIESIIPVRMFSMKYKANKESNPAYEAIERVKDSFTSAAAAGGIDGADCVRITRGSVNENIFVPKGSDKEVSFPEIQANFISKVSRATFNPLTRFTVNVAINSIKEEVKHEEATGALVVKTGIPQYGDKLDLVDFKVYKENAKNHIEKHWKKGDTVNIQGYINFSAKTEYVEEESGFGDAILIPKTTTVRELVITSGSSEPFDDERAYSKEELNTAMDERIGRITEKKAEAKLAASASSSNTANGKNKADSSGF